MKGNPDRVTIQGPGNAVRPVDIATAPLWVEMLLEGAVDGENTVMRASLDLGTIPRRQTHSCGLFVLPRRSLAQRERGAAEELRVGDAVWLAAGEKHWQGATHCSPFRYISIQATEVSRIVDWLEPVEALS
ncbi:quercetin dioxygenase-like cupin family protein [Rhizobium mesoamericanum]|uniref:cupin domain-containing protein n=1 Tax=Rhizobium mesoamericanum TaxID=1079800 RepID=UPI00277DC91A|nr:cupin domain-containing protein [Rhizobium mesoamericanum]MDQ0558809.1 quercetin dioxygenase-like cupin family protein [Rhizobium mesoamericanum]